MENKQFTPIDQELKDNIKKVFDAFDKDKSGSIDRKEVVAMAKELGQEVTEEEVEKIFADIDTNKDKKISFKEFEAWWCYGKVNKMGKLVYFKLKAMNSLDKVKKMKSKYGKFLSESYDSSNIDNFNFGIKIGELEPKTRLEVRGYVGKDADDLFEATKKEMNIHPDFSVVFKLKTAIDPATALNNLKEIVNGALEMAKTMFPDEATALVDNMLKFEYRHDEENIYVGITSEDEFFFSTIKDYQQDITENFGEHLKANFHISFGLKNDLKTLLEKYSKDKVVLAFLEGMWLIIEAKLNSNLLKTFRTQLLASLEEWGTEYIDESTRKTILFSMMQGATAELTFDDLERDKAAEFLKGIGSGEALDATPAFGDLLDLAKQSDPSELINAIPFVNELLQFLRANIKCDISLHIKVPKLFIVTEFKTSGIKECFDYIMDRND